jgi:hypothetical protein
MQILSIVVPAYHTLQKFCNFVVKWAKMFSYILQTIFIWYGIRLQVNVVPQCHNTLQYVVSYVKFLEDFVQTKKKKKNRWIVFTSLKTNRWKLAWLWATNFSSHNFRQKRCYTMMTFWRTTESVYMACWIPISIIYNSSFN